MKYMPAPSNITTIGGIGSISVPSQVPAQIKSDILVTGTIAASKPETGAALTKLLPDSAYGAYSIPNGRTSRQIVFGKCFCHLLSSPYAGAKPEKKMEMI